MEGACGKILTTEDPNVVLKKVYRRNRPQQRSCSLRAEAQATMQECMRNLCVQEKLDLLYVPRAWDAEKHSYKMDRIEVDKPLEVTATLDAGVLKELRRFYRAAMAQGIFPLDYELYLQRDGRVAMVDFDKFSVWNKEGTITFPWGVTTDMKVIRDQYPYLLE